MKYSIVYSTRTGNTKLLADNVRDVLPKEGCIYFGSPSPEALVADRLYVGFWTNKGTCDKISADFLKTIKNKEIFLFGTAGFGQDKSYFEKILVNTQKNLDKSVTIKGSFMCQGKMPMSVRQRYEKMLKSPVPVPNLRDLIENFDKASTHPDGRDLALLREYIKKSVKEF